MSKADYEGVLAFAERVVSATKFLELITQQQSIFYHK
jgi:hypothetical protein